MEPAILNFKDIRKIRQKNNNMEVYYAIIQNNIEKFFTNINEKQLERVLEDLDLPLESLLEKAKNDLIFCKLLSALLAKNASRQGKKDEIEQIRTCTFVAEYYGIQLNQKIDIRATKTGRIITRKEMLKEKIPKDSCLKSFDAQISGRMKGYITAKVAFGNGGHQDNVFEELDTIALWWKKYIPEENNYLIIILDTDLILKKTALLEKYREQDNIKIFDHVEFQKFIIDNNS